MTNARGMRRRPAAMTALLAAVIAGAPFTLDFGAASAPEFLIESTAAAKDSDNSGSGGGDDSDSGGDDGDDSDNSGSGGGGGDSGSGDDGDDNSGSGGGDGDDDDGDNSGPGGGDDDGGGRGRGRGEDGGSSAGRVGHDGARIEIRGGAIQVLYRGGWKEEIRNGRLELKDPRGRTVVRRRATPEDFARLQALAR